MQKIEVFIRPEAVAPVRDALAAAGAGGMTFVQAQGMGSQHGFTEYVRGTEVIVQTQPKVVAVVVCGDDEVDGYVDAICAAARTGEEGKVGDGKVFVSPVSRALRIRTGETGDRALGSAGA